MKMMRKVINDGAGDDEGVEPVGGAERQVHDPDGWMPGQLAPAATVQQEIWT